MTPFILFMVLFLGGVDAFIASSTYILSPFLLIFHVYIFQAIVRTFVGKSEYLLSVSHGSKPRLSIWTMSKLAASWSYRLQVEAVSCSMDLSSFAILALLPESDKCTFRGDGIILLFNVTDPIPVASWSVEKTLLAYFNGDHEYVLFDPYSKEVHEIHMIRQDDLVAFEETGQFGYASIYGELPEFDLKQNTASFVTSAPSEKPWETIFSGLLHTLPPLTKLCSEFLESLLEKRTAIVE